MNVGERIYYTGDICNESDRGTIVAVNAGGYDVKWDSGESGYVYRSGVDHYQGHGDPRFSPLAEVEAWRERIIRAAYGASV
jgi:hypothetical protein